MCPKSDISRRLASSLPGASVRITGVDGGGRVQSRLVGMGLIVGTRLDVRSNDGGGPVLLAVGHSRIALGRAMAEKVRVESVSGRVAVRENTLRSA